MVSNNRVEQARLTASVPGSACWSLPNCAVEQTAGSNALAAAAHRGC